MKRCLKSSWLGSTALVLASVTLLGATGVADAAALRDKWCSKVHLRFFVGGAEGDAFGTIVYNGARQAASDTGAQVDYVFSGWANEKMTQQLREAVAAHPDGIAMMGHPGEAAILPLAEKAAKAGIKMIYQNVPVPAAVDKVGGGYIGAQQAPQGRALGVEIVRRFGLGKADLAIVILASNDVIRNARRGDGQSARGKRCQGRPPRQRAGMGSRSEPRYSRRHRGFPGQSDGQGDRISRRADARQRRGLHESRRQEAGRGLQYRLRHQPADCPGVRTRLGAANG